MCTGMGCRLTERRLYLGDMHACGKAVRAELDQAHQRERAAGQREAVLLSGQAIRLREADAANPSPSPNPNPN